MTKCSPWAQRSVSATEVARLAAEIMGRLLLLILYWPVSRDTGPVTIVLNSQLIQGRLLHRLTCSWGRAFPRIIARMQAGSCKHLCVTSAAGTWRQLERRHSEGDVERYADTCKRVPSCQLRKPITAAATAVHPSSPMCRPVSDDKGFALAYLPVDQKDRYRISLPSTSSTHLCLEDLEKFDNIGKVRPPQFQSFRSEVAFVLCLSMAQFLQEYLTEGYVVLLPTLGHALDIPDSSMTWSASAFSLAISSFLFTFGRLADMYGGFPVYLGGLTWLSIWTFIAAFTRTNSLLILCRAMQGLGAAAYLPASLDMLGSMYYPGRRKNIAFSVYGAMAPVGSGIGILAAGLVSQYASWPWFFWIAAALAVLTVIASYASISPSILIPPNPHTHMDWAGSIVIPMSLVSLMFTITDIAHLPRGSHTIYIYITGSLGVAMMLLAFYVEGYYAQQPLVPIAIFRPKYMRPFVLGLLLSYGTIGIYVLYATL